MRPTLRQIPPILLWSFLLLAITATVLPSCGISRKGTSRTTEADTVDTEARRAALWEEFGEEDFQPLPAKWDEPYKRKYRREQAQLEKQLARERRLAGMEEPDSTITWEVPLDVPGDTIGMSTPPDESGGFGSTPTGEAVPEQPGDSEAAQQGDEPETAPEEQPGDLKKVDYTGDIMRPLHITDDSTAVYILGNVVFYHNGAVITCDSAVRYSEKRMEFYKRVVINNGTTYVYGDRAEYNGEINMARVYSPIVKVVDEEAVLYTYNFSYNTLTEVGRYWGGGTLTHRDSQMESLRGYYNTETREFTGAGEVELTNPDYKMISDSVRYNLDTEVAEFFVPTRIWNSKGEILLADRGKYRSASEDYEFTRNSYILTETQEMWADSMRHFATTDHTVFRRDIQIIDEENNSMAFGDYGEYFGETEHGMLTIEPSLISFDTEEPDTLYMRSDSMFFYTYPHDHVFEGLDSTGGDERDDYEELLERPAAPDSGGIEEGEETSVESADEEGEEGELTEDGQATVTDGEEVAGEEEGPPDEPVQAAETDTADRKPTKKEERQAKKEAKKTAKLRDKKASEPDGLHDEAPGEDIPAGDSEEIDGADEQDVIDTEEEIDDDGEDITESEEPEPELYVSPYGELTEKLYELMATDSVSRAMTPEEFWLNIRDEISGDSTRMNYYYEVVGDALSSGEIDMQEVEVPDGGIGSIMETVIEESRRVVESIPAIRPGEDIEESDSVQRVFYGYRNVRIFRDDFQAVCDSIVGFSRDSTLHMHINPVMWSDQNQVVSDMMIIFTRDEQLYKAEFHGSPFMSSEVDSIANQYNQIKGKFMTAWFRDNDIYRHDVFGNGQTHYYMEDEDTREVQGLMICESSDITFFIEEQTIDEIIYRGMPDYIIYPIEMIPPEVDQILPGFTWDAHRRPMTKEDVHTRAIRPRQREEVRAFPQPTFPLTGSIENRKEELTRLNIWRDRNDTLSPLALDFVRDVELKYAEEALNAR